MVLATLIDHLFGVPHLLIGLAMLRWHKRFAAAMLKSQEAFVETLDFKPITRWHNFWSRFFGPRFACGLLLVMGVIFTIVGSIFVVVGPED